jgi:hypothetical protein
MFLTNISVYTSLSRAHLLDKRSKVEGGGGERLDKKQERERERERER